MIVVIPFQSICQMLSENLFCCLTRSVVEGKIVEGTVVDGTVVDGLFFEYDKHQRRPTIEACPFVVKLVEIEKSVMIVNKLLVLTFDPAP